MAKEENKNTKPGMAHQKGFDQLLRGGIRIYDRHGRDHRRV